MKIFNKDSRFLRRFKAPNCDHSLSTSSGCDMSGEVSAVANQSVLVIEISDRTDAIIRGLVFLLDHHGAPQRVQHELKEQVRTYLNSSSDEAVWMKRSKYLLTFPLSKYLRNELPPSPDLLPKFSGVLRRWIKARMNAFNRKNTHLWYSWLQSKRCALPVSDDMIDEAYKKHFSQLTKPDPCQPSPEGVEHREIEKMFNNPTFRHVLNSVRDEITRTYVPNFHEKVASTSACFENTRSNKGQYGELRSFLESVPSDTFGLDDPNSIEEQEKDYLYEDQQKTLDIAFLVSCGLDQSYAEKEYTPRLDHSDRCIPIRANKHFTPFLGCDELVRMYQQIAVRKQTQHEVCEQRERAGRYRWKMLKNLEEYRATTQVSNLYATIQAVLEPLKIRIISKGPAFEYYQMKPLQKSIHAAMRDMPCFRLIGRKLYPTDLLDLVWARQVRKPYSDEWEQLEWISVDYSAATDGLSSELGLKILDYLLRDIDPLSRAVAAKVLGPHDLFYPKRKGKKWGDPQHAGLQTNGQLMGGILSFPVLCLANLAVYLRTIKSKSLEDLDRVLVNGDDMLYVGTEDEWKRHSRIASSVGLEMSVGKAYKHVSYANANSTSFQFNLADPKSTPWQINYLNSGLVFGQHKVQQRTAGTAENHHADVNSCVANIPAILDGSLPSRQCSLLQHVLQSRRDEVLLETHAVLREGRKVTDFHRNLFLPIPFGGMGLEAPVGWKYHVKKIDRRVALSQVLSCCANLEKIPTLGYPIESCVDPIPPWVAKVPEPIPTEFSLLPAGLRKVPIGVHVRTWPNRSAYLC